MEKPVPIETIAGILNGRDCFYFDTVVQDNYDNVIFTGDINGHLVKEMDNKKDWYPYKLTFKRVLACFYCELDTYENLASTGYLHDGSSCFDLIENSDWLKSLPIREDFDKSIYNHYRLFTYDIVYNIIATEYQLEVDI